MNWKLLWLSLGILMPFFLFKTINKGKQEPPEPSVLIFSMKTSGGHDAVAKALQNRFNQLRVPSNILYVDDYDYFSFSTIYDTLMRTSIGRNTLNLINKVFWNNGENYLYFSYKYFANEDIKKKYNPFCMISVIPFFYKALQDLNKEYPNAKSFIIPTDVYNPYKKYWISDDNTNYLLGSKMLMEIADDKPNKKEISGMILRPEFTEDIKSREERRKQLNTLDNRPLITLLFGGSGSDQMEDLMYEIIRLRLDQKYLFAFITGKNKALKRRLEILKSQNNIDCLIRGYESDIYLWMQASNILVGKPGPGIIFECQASHLPIIIIEKDILSQEIYNLQIARKMGICIQEYSQFEKAIKEILNNSTKYEQFFDQLPKNQALNEAVDIILAECFGNFANEKAYLNNAQVNFPKFLKNSLVETRQPLQIATSRIV